MRTPEPIPAADDRVWVPEPVKGRGDAEVARLAARQWAVVDIDQLHDAGLGRHAIAHRIRRGRLRPEHAGVFLVGRPSRERFTSEMAAVLIAPGYAVVSHRSAGAVWGLCDVPDTVTITVVGRDLRSRRAIQVHRTQALDPVDLLLQHGLPVTAPARTLIDLAATMPTRELEQAVAEARVQRLIAPGDLQAAIARVPHRKGVAAIKALLAAEHDPAYTRRGLERRFLGLIRQAQLPAPRVNARLHGFQIDFFWPDQRLVVETDGGQFHDHPRAFENDRRRDQILLAAGYRVMRITWRQLRDEPYAVIARLAQTLAAAAAAA